MKKNCIDYQICLSFVDEVASASIFCPDSNPTAAALVIDISIIGSQSHGVTRARKKMDLNMAKVFF